MAKWALFFNDLDSLWKKLPWRLWVLDHGGKSKAAGTTMVKNVACSMNNELRSS